MSSLIFRKYRSADKVELSFDNIEVLSVHEVREMVSSTMGVALEDLSKCLDINRLLGYRYT